MCVSTNGLCGFCDSNLATERPTVPKPTSAILSFLLAEARCSGAICSATFDSGRGATDSHLLLNCAQKTLGRKLAGNFRQSKPPRANRRAPSGTGARSVGRDGGRIAARQKMVKNSTRQELIRR